MTFIILPALLILVFLLFGVYWFSPEFKVQILIWRNANVRARKILEYLLEQHPERLNLYQKLGSIYYQENRQDRRALRVFEIILKLRVPFEWRDELLTIVAKHYTSEGRNDAEAVRMIERAVEKEADKLASSARNEFGFHTDNKRQKTYIIMLAALADIYLDKGLFAEAAKRYNQVLELKVSNRRIYQNLSKALLRLQRFDGYALGIFQKTIEYDANNEEIYLTLAQSFLAEQRDDDHAIQIYEKALKFDSPYFADLTIHLSDIYQKDSQFTECVDITQRLLQKQGYHRKAVTRFMTATWQTRQYDKCIGQLKTLLDRSEQKSYLRRFLCSTYLEMRFNADSDTNPKYSHIDRQIIMDHLDSTTSFDTLQDIVFFIELKRFLSDQDCWGKLLLLDISEESQAYALVEQGEAKQTRTTVAKKSETNMTAAILGKMQSFSGLASTSSASHSSLTFEDFQRGDVVLQESQATLGQPADMETDILIVLELSNFRELTEKHGHEQVQKNRIKLFAMMADLLEKYRFSQIWGTDNGLVMFSKDILQSVSFAVDLLNKVNRYNFVSDHPDELHLAIGIHHTRDGLHGNDQQGLKDFDIGIKTASASEADLPDEDRTIYGKIFEKTNRIFLSSKAYREIKSSKRFKVNSIGQFKLRYIKEQISLHEVAWRNPVDDLKFGFVKKLGRFDLLAEIASKGEDIKVYKGKDSDLQRFVIVKVIQSDVFNSLPASNPHKQEFYQKAKSFGQMHHPNIANIYEVDEDLGLTYISREYVEGQNITELFRNNEVNIEQLIKVMFEVFKGLQYSHRLGYVHLNLKPNNIRTDGNSEAKIMDFEIPSSLLAYQRYSADENFYRSPEQAAGQSADPRSDIFAMGVILYETVTGRHPFAAKDLADYTEAIRRITPSLPSSINPKIPKFLDALIMRCMAPQPEKRIQSAEQIVTLLKKNFERTLFSNFNYHIAQSRMLIDKYTKTNFFESINCHYSKHIECTP